MQEETIEKKPEEAKTNYALTLKNGQPTRFVKAVKSLSNLKLIVLAICFIIYIIATQTDVLDKEDLDVIKNVVHEKIDEKFAERDKMYDTLLTAVKANAEAIRETNEAVNRLHPLEEED